MRKLSFKILLPVLCTVALTVSTFGSFGALSVSATASSANSILSKYDIDSYNGMIQTGKAGDGIVTAWDILEVDGYIDGCWYPWLTHTYLGSSLAPNDLEDYDSYLDSDGSTKDYWQPMNKAGIDNIDNEQLKAEIFNLKALGFNMMAYAGSPWGEGRQNDLNTWECTGVKEEYLTNIRRFLDICREVGMPVVWYIHFHSSAVPNYINLDMWYKIDQVKACKEYADAYAENFVEPVCQVLAEYRDVVVMCGIADETFNEINDPDLGDKFAEGSREQYGVTMEDAMYFHAQIGKTVKQVMPDMPTTCADNADQYAMYGDAMLDMPGRNQYSSGTTASTNVTNAWATGPLLAGEYGVGDGAYSGTEQQWSTVIIGKREAYLNAGYSGFFHWAYQTILGSGSAGGNQFLKANAETVYDFRQGMYDGYFWAESKKNELGDKTKNTTGNPSAMYYSGDGKVYWIQPKNQTGYTVEYTTNGGNTWTVATGNVVNDTTTGGYRHCMTVTNDPKSGTVQFRITVNDKTSYTNVWTY